MNFGALARLVRQLLVDLPTTPVPTDAVPDARMVATSWSGLMAVCHSRTADLFCDPVVRAAIVRHTRTVAIVNEQIDAATGSGRRDISLARNAWEAVLQVTITRRDLHRQVATLALIQLLNSSSELMADLSTEEQACAHSLLGIRCPEAVPIAAVQALRMYSESVHEMSMPGSYGPLPDLLDSFPCCADDNESESKHDEDDTPLDPSPAELSRSKMSLADICAGLEGAVVGQWKAVRAFAACAYRHLHGIQQGAVLVTGQTGVGKTSLASAWARMSDRPLVVVDCASLVAEGIRGGTISDSLIAIWNAAGKDLAKASTGILIFDEADKLAGNRFAVQLRNTLLKLLEGGDWRAFDPEKVERGSRLDVFPTKDLMVVMCGSFTDVRDEAAHRLGFHAADEGRAASPGLSLEILVPFSDLRGRISCHIELHPLDRTALRAILLSANGPLRGLRALFPGWQVQPSESLIERIVAAALENGLGARGLWPLIRDLETELLFDPPVQPGEHLGVQFGWRIRTGGDGLPRSVREVLHAHIA